MWQTGGPTRTSPDYNCEVANPACQTTLGYPPVAVRLVGGGATSHSRLVRNGLPSSPSLISIRLTAEPELPFMPYLHPKEEEG